MVRTGTDKKDGQKGQDEPEKNAEAPNSQPQKSVRKKRYQSYKIGAGYNSDDEYYRPRIASIDESGIQFITVNQLALQLKKKGLQIAEMPGDGNCLFHSVADQIYGDNTFHDVVRKLCMDYMEKERNHFSQFVAAESFTDYLTRKRNDGVHGNHLELQAISEIYSRPVEIFAINEDPLNIFQGSYEIDNPPIRLSYHYGNHYNSVRDPLNPGIGYGLGLPGLQNGEKMTTQDIKKALLESEQAMIERTILERTKKESDDTAIEEQIIQQTVKELELDQIETQYLHQMQTESENEYFNKVIHQTKMETEDDDIKKIIQQTQKESEDEYMNKMLQQAKMESEDDQFKMVLEQTRKEQEDAELRQILEQSRKEHFAASGGGNPYYYNDMMEKAIMEQSLLEYYSNTRR